MKLVFKEMHRVGDIDKSEEFFVEFEEAEYIIALACFKNLDSLLLVPMEDDE